MTMLAAVALAGFGTSTAAHAQDRVYTRSSKDKVAHTGMIKQESPRGIVIEGVKQEIPAEEIREIIYHIEPFALRTGFYNLAIEAEKEAQSATDDKRRIAKLAEAVQKYEDTQLQLKEQFAFAKRHLEFKSAALGAQLAQEQNDPKALETAIRKLRDFKTKHAQSWQLTRALELLGQLLVEQGAYDEAEQNYRELAEANVPERMQREAELLALRVALKAGQHLARQGKQGEADKKFAAAEKNLQKLQAALPKGSPEQVRAVLAQAEALAGQKKFPDAQKLIKDVQNTIKKEDQQLKALAYNALGYCYYLNEQWPEARWQFLWVDAVYHQDRAEHAKALYYLADIFARLGDSARAREFLDILRTDRQFAGLEYQRRALREEKKTP
jgi:tetratricopeptide (TPR) repeat protein